jgi:hypothetical protein
MMKKCPYCAEKIKPNAATCRHCGRELPQSLPDMNSNGSKHPPKQKALRIWLVAISIFSIIAILLGSAVLVVSVKATSEIYTAIKTRQDTKHFIYYEKDVVCGVEGNGIIKKHCYGRANFIQRLSPFLFTTITQMALLLFGTIGMWVLHARGKTRLAFALSFLPLLSVLVCSSFTYLSYLYSLVL